MATRKKASRKEPYNVEQKRTSKRGKANANSSQDVSSPDIILPTASTSTTPQPTVPNQNEQSNDASSQFITRSEFVQLQSSMNNMSSVFNNLLSALQNKTVLPSTVVTNQPVASSGLAAVVNQPQSSNPMTGISGVQNVPSQVDNSSDNMNSSMVIDPTPGVSFAVPSTSQVIDDVVHSAVNNHLSSIVNPGECFAKTKVSYQVDRRIPEKTLQLIWEDQYVDLATMIPKEVDPETPLQLIHGKPGEPATWAPVKSDKIISSISQWSDLFDIYVAAYSRKHPSQTPNLLTHKFNVIQLNSEGSDFLFYDIEFRKARAKFGIPWENPDMQLWVKAANKGIQRSLAMAIGSSNVPNIQSTSGSQNIPNKSNNQPFRQGKGSNSGAGNKLRHPSGYCFHFHNKRCGKTNCRFLHQCWMPGCGEKHSVYKCPKLQNQNKFQKTNSSSGSKPSANANANKS